MALDNGFLFKRILVIAMFFFPAVNQNAVCQATILDSLLTFRTGEVKTGNALSIISRHTGYNFTYDSRLINTSDRVDLTFNNERLCDILNSVLKNDSLVYSVIDKYIIISKAVPAPAGKAESQQPEEILFIKGIVIDAESSEPLPFATIALKNYGRGSVTNNNGEFGIKLASDILADTLSISYLGYMTREIPVAKAVDNYFTISLIREFISIPEIIIKTQVPQEIIYKSLSAISRNYGNTPAMLTGFYREGILKKQELQIYSEAILHIYKSSYSGSLFNDQIKVFKSRKIENIDLRDTLALRLKAGLSTSLELDGIKNIFEFISRENMAEYTYRISDIVQAGDDAAYVIDFEQRPGIELPLFRGSLYINTEDFAIIYADFELHPKYLNMMKDSFVSSSSRGFNTWPESVRYSVTYRKVHNRYFLSHVRGDLLFSSRQKKRLFNSQFNVFFELAITSMDTDNVTRFEREELAPIHSVFSKTITSYDEDFWGDQDFLKPEDDLLQSLKNMKVRLQEFSE